MYLQYVIAPGYDIIIFHSDCHNNSLTSAGVQSTTEIGTFTNYHFTDYHYIPKLT